MKDRKLREALGYKEIIEIPRDLLVPGICRIPKIELEKVECIESKLNQLETTIEYLQSQLQNQPIGEYYSTGATWQYEGTYKMTIAYTNEGQWTKFSQKDIDDQVNGKIKIKGQWHDKKNVVFYNDISKQKKKIERRNKETINENI